MASPTKIKKMTTQDIQNYDAWRTIVPDETQRIDSLHPEPGASPFAGARYRWPEPAGPRTEEEADA
jgi:hypothetical protein